MQIIKGIIFDLDGTLLYTLDDIADAENSARAELNLPPLPVEDYRWIVGGGADDLARKLLPENRQSNEDIIKFVERFRYYYHLNWHHKTKLYPGISELIKFLRDKQYPLAILSNKPEEFALKIVDYYFPDWQGISKPKTFTHVIGQRKGCKIKPDPAAALEIATEWNISPEFIGLVGDSDIDIITAHNAGMISVGAEWGFRGSDELAANNAHILLTSPLDLIKYLD